MTWIGVSVPIRPGMVVYEGDPPVRLERTASIDNGDLANVTVLNFGAHTGTHIDAPVHFLGDDHPGVEGIDPEVFIGHALVVDLSWHAGNIDATVVEGSGLPSAIERVLFKTGNSWLWDRETFADDYVGMTEDGAKALLEHGVRLVGIDYLSIAPKSDPAPTHRALLAAGCVIVEGLDLREVEPGPYDLVCLPLLIPGSDGAPARVLVRRRPG